MRFTDERAKNLFVRLFTYSPRTGERSELENYCTEALAWCLIKSHHFATAFLEAVSRRLKEGPGPILGAFVDELQIDTQIGFNGEDVLEATTSEGDDNNHKTRYQHGGRFDLLLSSGERNGFLIAIESKVKLDLDLPRQINEYRRTLDTKGIRERYNSFSEPYVLTLTPSMSEDTDAHGHLSWGDIHSLIHQMAQLEKTPEEFSAFAEFLDSRHLSRVDIPPLTRDLCQNVANSARFLEKVKGLFNRFGNDRTLRTFFRPFALSRPTIGFEENIAWYGVWDTRDERWAYAGFFIKGDVTGLYVDAEYPGDKRDECAKLSNEAKAAVEEANRLIPEAKSNRDRKTWLRFACELEPEVMESKESSDYYLQWFTRILSDIKRVFG